MNDFLEGLGNFQDSFLSPQAFRYSMPDVWDGFVLNIE